MAQTLSRANSASAELLEKILSDIKKKQRTLALRNLSLCGAAIILSLLAFVPAVKMFLSDVQVSGFATFFSLMFSDSSTMMRLWQAFLMMLLESFPAVSFSIVLAVLLLALQSIISFSRNVRIALR
jgi:hypothetical protein